MTPPTVIELSDANFDDEVFSGSDPILVEFWSEGSYACREVEGVLDRLAEEYRDQVRVGRLDADASWQTAEQYDVRTFPTVLVFQNGRVVDRIEGARSPTDYRQAVHEVIAQHWVI